MRAKDYEPQSFILTVAGRGRAQTALVQLERRKAELALETDPEGAEVWIDGEGTVAPYANAPARASGRARSISSSTATPLRALR